MQTMTKSWIKYLLILGGFGVGINIINLALPIYMMIVYDRVLFSFSLATLATLTVGVLFSLLIMGSIEYCRRRLLTQMANMLVQDVMPSVLRKMHKDAQEINQHGYTRGIVDLECLRNAIAQGQIFSLLELPWILIYLGILFFIHPLVGGVATAAVVMVAWFQAMLLTLEKRRHTIADIAFQASSDFARSFLRHAEVVTAMGMHRPLHKKYLEAYYKIIALRSEVDRFDSAIGSVLQFLSPTALVAVFGAGVYMFYSNGITTGAIISIVMIMARLLVPFERNLLDMKTAIEAIASFKRLRHHIRLHKQKDNLSLPMPEGRFSAEALALTLHNRSVFHNISFALEPGEILGIIGASSVGKTSLCKVLLGIWPMTGGKVRLDGAEILQWPEDELRQHVGYMPQESELLAGTVAENIARFQRVDSDKVVAAAQKAGSHEIILRFPQGYETRIDQTGKNLSAGQRQLISLARALYDDPKFVILDEPHAHMDDAGFSLVLKALHFMRQKKITVIVVTDRSHILTLTDKLLVMRDGQMAMYGPSKEVLAQLVNKQQPQQKAA